MPFGDKLKNARINAGLTQKQLANLIGAKHNSISNWENNQNMPDPNMIEAICGVLKVSPSYLLLNNSDNIDDPYFIEPREQAHITKYRQLNTDGQNKVDEYTTDLVDSGKYAAAEQPVIDIKYTDMPVYNEPAAAGTGNYLQESSYETMSFPADSIPAGAEFGVRISGDSMEPIIKDGNIVWVKPQVSIENGEIGIFVLNNDAFCKRLHIDYDNKIVELISDNPDYQPIIVTKNDNLFTMGKVLGINSKAAPDK